MSKFWQAVILAAVAFLVTLLVYPLVLKFAVRHHIYDNPDARKLQRQPVPVMGGVIFIFCYGIINQIYSVPGHCDHV